ncbi:hypothetical protein R4227_06000 [Gordonia amicalis]|uniref:hypothetical protein n=1 Tax=Gordonia amicalis TaxID=89053 RepID=UPI002952AF52|nr:hypothetical protein [Gordonia amicalis]MDV7099694.1 hypothetical protein [Gordonia amicalis]
MSELDTFKVLFAASEAASAAMYGPIPEWLTGWTPRYDVVSDDEGACRWFTLTPGAAGVTVYETQSGHLSVDVDFDGDAASRQVSNAVELRSLAAELLAAAETYEQAHLMAEQSNAERRCHGGND